MNLFISSDGTSIVNIQRIGCFKVVSEEGGYAIMADGIELSHHTSLDRAKKELIDMFNFGPLDSVIQLNDTTD